MFGFRVYRLVLICLIILAVGTAASAWDIYVSTQINGTVNKYDSTGAPLGVFASGMSNAQDLSFGKYGDLYVVDYNGGAAVANRYNGTTGALVSTIGTNMKDALGITTDSNYAYVLHRYTGTDLGMVSRLDPDNPANQTELVGAGAGYMYEPTDIELGSDGNLYVLAKDAEFPALGNRPALYVFGRDGAFIGKRVTNSGGKNLTIHDGYAYWTDLWAGTVNRLDISNFNAAPIQNVPLTGYGDPIQALGIQFGPDGNMYLGNYFNNRALRFSGTGAFQAEFAFVSPGHAINFAFTPVPEPASLMALAAGLLGMAGAYRRRK